LDRELPHFRSGVFAEFAPTAVGVVNGLPDWAAFYGTDRRVVHIHTSMKRPLADFDLERAIGLRWALRDIVGNRLQLTPGRDDDLRTLIELGFVEMRDDAPVVTQAGLAALD